MSNYDTKNISGSNIGIFTDINNFSKKIKKGNYNKKLNSEVKDRYEGAKNNLEAAKSHNGLIEKVADFFKEKTGIGVSSNKIQKDIAEGKKTEDEINKDIKNYRRSQSAIAQAVADTVSAGASIISFFGFKNFAQLEQAQSLKVGNGNRSWILLPEKILKTKPAILLAGTVLAGLIGSQSKVIMLKMNRIGTNQYTPQLQNCETSKDIEQEKKEVNSKKLGADFRNFATGTINGITTPILALGPIGVPIYAAVNSLSRYFIADKEDKGEKGLDSYVNNISNSKVTTVLTTAAIAGLALKKAKFSVDFEKNLNLAVEKVLKAELKPFGRTTSTYEQLEEILCSDKEIAAAIKKSIEKNDTTPLIQKNIFAAKFIQITGNESVLSKMLKNSNKRTRSSEKAQILIDDTFGKGEYSISKEVGDNGLVGVGTIAETYIAKDKKGKELCIKLLRTDITKQKILDDKKDFIEIIQNLPDKSEQEKEFLIKNIESIADGVLSEVNFKNEMEAAQKLAKVTEQAKVVKPIEVKDNIYLMDKADGICLQNLMQEIKDGKISLSGSEAKQLFELYTDVIIEQFSKVSPKGKILHGDIHPGNVFVDINALKDGKKNCITLIDTGNTIVQDPNTAIRFINLSKYIANADIKNIAKFVLDGAKLPQGMTKEQAQKELSSQLSQVFFDTTTELKKLDNESIITLAESIMQKLNIIPSNTQGNLMKAQKSAFNSFKEFGTTYYASSFGNIEFDKLSKKDKAELLWLVGRYAVEKTWQEKLNILKLPLQQIMELNGSNNTPQKNGLEYLIYKLKPYKNTH